MDLRSEKSLDSLPSASDSVDVAWDKPSRLEVALAPAGAFVPALELVGERSSFSADLRMLDHVLDSRNLSRSVRVLMKLDRRVDSS
jgi:hypothetical protein